MRHTNTGQCDLYTKTKANNRNYLWEQPDIRFIRKRFKVDIISVFKNLNESMIKEIKDSMMTILREIENISKNIEIIFLKRTKWEF